MFLRIAPELYLKRLLVGGFDKVFELNRSWLFIIAGDNNPGNIQFPFSKIVDQAQNISIVGDAEIRAHFLALNITGIYTNDNFCALSELMQ